MTAGEKRERRQAKHEFQRAIRKNISLRFPNYIFCATTNQLKQATKSKADQIAAQFNRVIDNKV